MVVQMSTINEDTYQTQVMPVLLNLWDRYIFVFPPLTTADFTMDTMSSDGVNFFCKLPGCIGCSFGVCKGTPNLTRDTPVADWRGGLVITNASVDGLWWGQGVNGS
jgi:hypothetical protein